MRCLRMLDRVVRSIRRHPTGGVLETPMGRIYPACGKTPPLAALPKCLGCATRRWVTVGRVCGPGPAATVPPGPSLERAGVRGGGGFSVGSNWLLLNRKPWGWSFPPPTEFLDYTMRLRFSFPVTSVVRLAGFNDCCFCLV